MKTYFDKLRLCGCSQSVTLMGTVRFLRLRWTKVFRRNENMKRSAMNEFTRSKFCPMNWQLKTFDHVLRCRSRRVELVSPQVWSNAEELVVRMELSTILDLIKVRKMKNSSHSFLSADLSRITEGVLLRVSWLFDHQRGERIFTKGQLSRAFKYTVRTDVPLWDLLMRLWWFLSLAIAILFLVASLLPLWPNEIIECNLDLLPIGVSWIRLSNRCVADKLRFFCDEDNFPFDVLCTANFASCSNFNFFMRSSSCSRRISWSWIFFRIAYDARREKRCEALRSKLLFSCIVAAAKAAVWNSVRPLTMERDRWTKLFIFIFSPESKSRTRSRETWFRCLFGFLRRGYAIEDMMF